jgi:hypothetical protein
MPNRFFLRSQDVPSGLEDFTLIGVAKVDGMVSLIVSSSDQDGDGHCPLSEQDRKNLIAALSEPGKLADAIK